MWNKKNCQLSFFNCQLIIALLSVAFLAGCSDDDNVSVEKPSAQGTFVDARDGKEYHYIHVGGLDWSVENLSYDLNDQDLACVYQNVDDYQKGDYSTVNAAKYGMLYSYEGALQAIPDGWRLPTDADWKALEASHAYLGEDFRLLYGGYFTKNTAATAYNGASEHRAHRLLPQCQICTLTPTSSDSIQYDTSILVPDIDPAGTGRAERQHPSLSAHRCVRLLCGGHARQHPRFALWSCSHPHVLPFSRIGLLLHHQDP